MDLSIEWQIRQGLLERLVGLGTGLELACDIISRIHIDVPDDQEVTDTLMAQHAAQLCDMIRLVEQITMPLFIRKALLHRLPYTTETMIRNLASQYHVLIGA